MKEHLGTGILQTVRAGRKGAENVNRGRGRTYNRQNHNADSCHTENSRNVLNIADSIFLKNGPSCVPTR